MRTYNYNLVVNSILSRTAPTSYSNYLNTFATIELLSPLSISARNEMNHRRCQTLRVYSR